MNPFAADFKIEKKNDRKAKIKGVDIYTYSVRPGRETKPAKEVVNALSELEFTPTYSYWPCSREMIPSQRFTRSMKKWKGMHLKTCLI